MKLFLTTKERKKERTAFFQKCIRRWRSFLRYFTPLKRFRFVALVVLRSVLSFREGWFQRGKRKERNKRKYTLFYARRGGEKLYLRPCSSKIICWILVDSPPLHSIEYKCEIDIERNYRKKNNIKKWIISIFFEHTFVNIGKKRKRNF